MKATKEKIKYIVDLLEKEDIVCNSVQNFDSENEYGYNDFDDRIYIDGDITFDLMAKIVEFLKFHIRQGYIYKCKKDVYDNTGKVCLFKKDKYYLCPSDNILVTDNKRGITWQEWHKPQECFEEVDEI